MIKLFTLIEAAVLKIISLIFIFASFPTSYLTHFLIVAGVLLQGRVESLIEKIEQS